MNIIIIGNIVSFIGAMIMVSIGLIKKKNHVVIVQCLQFLIMGLGNLILGGISGFISNVVGIARNLFCLKWKFTWPFKLLFMALQVAIFLFGIIFITPNTLGIIGWFPIIAACLFTWYLDTENVILLKAVIITTELLWICYDIRLINVSSCVFDVLTIVTNLIGIIRIKTDKKSKAVIETAE